MGNNEDGKSTKPDKSSSSPVQQDQANVHVYADWAAMQAYYGPRVAIPPYYNSAVASGHAPPHYMWPPQPMMAPYGPPYAAIYPHGGVYAHPGVPVGSQPQGGQRASASTAVGTPLNIDMPTKSTGNTDNGLMKKLKEFDGLAMSIGNSRAEDGAERKPLLSGDSEGSSHGSDGNTSGADQATRKRSREGSPIKEAKPEMTTSSDKMLGPTTSPGTTGGKPGGAVLSPGMTELKNSSNMTAKSSSSTSLSPTVPAEAWLQTERELKRERRKQSNRESARRSRLRKQAETEELARKVESLTAENTALRSEIAQLTEKSEKTKLENAVLLDKLKNTPAEHSGLSTSEDKRVVPVSTENLLSRVNNNSASDDKCEDGNNDRYEKDTNSGAKLHQLLDRSPRADAVAAG